MTLELSGHSLFVLSLDAIVPSPDIGEPGRLRVFESDEAHDRDPAPRDLEGFAVVVHAAATFPAWNNHPGIARSSSHVIATGRAPWCRT